MTLAAHLNAKITAVDLFTAFLSQVEQRALKSGFVDQISIVKASMDNLRFEHESLDMIWSEGAIYNIGFEKGIKAWKPFLKPGGYLAISEIT